MIDKTGSVSAATSVYALIGFPVQHSLSPRFWNAAFEKLQLDSVYVALPVLPENIRTALSGLKSLGVKGINITRPHKFAAAEFCQILHGAASETKIVNTIKFTENGAEGWNTDATGFFNLLNRKQLSRKSALVIGDGATSISAIWALKKYGVGQINQIARKITIETNEEISTESQKKFFLRKFTWNSKNFNNSIEISDIIINTTPIGWQKNDDIPEFANSLNSSKCFIDFNYSKDSKLLAAADRLCSITVDGRELLYEQGIEAFKVLTNYAPPADVIRSSIFD